MTSATTLRRAEEIIGGLETQRLQGAIRAKRIWLGPWCWRRGGWERDFIHDGVRYRKIKSPTFYGYMRIGNFYDRISMIVVPSKPPKKAPAGKPQLIG